MLYYIIKSFKLPKKEQEHYDNFTQLRALSLVYELIFFSMTKNKIKNIYRNVNSRIEKLFLALINSDKINKSDRLHSINFYKYFMLSKKIKDKTINEHIISLALKELKLIINDSYKYKEIYKKAIKDIKLLDNNYYTL